MRPRGVGIEHRMIDNQLAASLEDVAERLRPVLALEAVLLFDELPGQIAPLAAQLVTHPGELFLLRQVPLPCPEPLVVLHDLVGFHVTPPPQDLGRPTFPGPHPAAIGPDQSWKPTRRQTSPWR